MTLPDDVMGDLLTLYLAGEASAATRALVEQHARENAAFASRLEGVRDLPPLSPQHKPSGDLELRALSEARRFLHLRSAFWAGGIPFTLLPLIFSLDGGGVQFLILGRHPGLVWSFWSVAAASWVACYVMHRQVRHVGL